MIVAPILPEALRARMALGEAQKIARIDAASTRFARRSVERRMLQNSIADLLGMGRVSVPRPRFLSLRIKPDAPFILQSIRSSSAPSAPGVQPDA